MVQELGMSLRLYSQLMESSEHAVCGQLAAARPEASLDKLLLERHLDKWMQELGMSLQEHGFRIRSSESCT